MPDAPVRRLRGHTGPVTQVRFTPDGRRLISASGWPGNDDSVRVWDPADGREILRIPTPAPVEGLDLSRDGRFALAGLGDGTVVYLDLATGQVVRTLEGHDGLGVSWVASAADGQHVFSASKDGTVLLSELDEDKEVRRFPMRGKWARLGA